MLRAIYCFILTVWLAGIVTGHTLGGLLHLLLLQALIVVYVEFLELRQPLNNDAGREP